MDTSLSVREIKEEDITLIANYWLESESAFLVSMGVDVNKLPAREEFMKMLSRQIARPIKEKVSYALVWLANGNPVGHTNVNPVEFGNFVFMHLHLWKSEDRHKGIGTELIKKSLPYFFENLKLKELYSEPYTLNPAPHRALEKAGFVFEKRYKTIPGSLNFEQEVNRWKLTKEDYESIRGCFDLLILVYRAFK